jgi:hypothetical protein
MECYISFNARSNNPFKKCLLSNWLASQLLLTIDFYENQKNNLKKLYTVKYCIQQDLNVYVFEIYIVSNILNVSRNWAISWFYKPFLL